MNARLWRLSYRRFRNFMGSATYAMRLDGSRDARWAGFLEYILLHEHIKQFAGLYRRRAWTNAAREWSKAFTDLVRDVVKKQKDRGMMSHKAAALLLPGQLTVYAAGAFMGPNTSAEAAPISPEPYKLPPPLPRGLAIMVADPRTNAIVEGECFPDVFDPFALIT